MEASASASFPASSPAESQAEPDYGPDTSAAAPEPAPEMEKLAERNRVLTKKLKEAVTVANACHRALECERREGDEDVIRLQYGLMRTLYDSSMAKKGLQEKEK